MKANQIAIISQIRSQSWMMRSDLLDSFAMSISSSLSNARGGDLLDPFYAQFYELRNPMTINDIGVATVDVRGALMHRASPMNETLGLVTRYSTIISESNEAIQKGASSIIYKVDSPGGTVSGCQEASEFIAAISVPTVALCSGMACSAAYSLAAGCNVIISTPSSNVGSIGAIIAWDDASGFWANMGVITKAITSKGASLKSTFHTEPNDEQLQFLQDTIDNAGDIFKAHVIRGRSSSGASLDNEVFRAGYYSGERAFKLGLIDGIGNYDDAIAWIAEKLSEKPVEI